MVTLKNSLVQDWDSLAATLSSLGTKHLDMRDIRMSDKREIRIIMWSDCIKALSKVNTLVKLDLCRCTSFLVDVIPFVCPQLEYLSATAIRSSLINVTNLEHFQNLIELKLRGMKVITVNNVSILMNLTKLKQLSLTMVKNMPEVLEVVGKMTQLESLELGEMMNVTETHVIQGFSQLTNLGRLRLEKGQQDCPTNVILETISQLPSLNQLELINFDINKGFEESLEKCSNIKILLLIPTYTNAAALTNHLVIDGITRLRNTLKHFVWVVTVELLTITDLYINDSVMGPNNISPTSIRRKSSKDYIPILKPKGGPVMQMDLVQMPKLQKVLNRLLPNTNCIILKVPFSATWGQTISGSNQ